MRVDLITLFPEMCEAVLGESIIGRARKKGAIEVHCHQLRDFAFDKHRRVDDTPYGGGKGMLLICEPIALCIEHIAEEIGEKPYVVYMSPKGKPLNQPVMKNLAQFKNVTVLCGHYEGIDQRVLDAFVDEEISVGDYVLTGGELPALVLIDGLLRLAPGVLAGDECFINESHYDGMLEYPQYTKPANWRGMEVPEVLISGHHANIEGWKKEKSEEITKNVRPDLWKAHKSD